MGTAGLSAIRAFTILEYFEKVRTPLSLKTISMYLGLPTSSTAALLKTLSDRGYLSYDFEARTYLPTLRLATLGDWVPSRIMEDGVFELVRQLRERTPHTIVLATLNDLFVESIDFKLSRRDANLYFLEEDYAPTNGAATITCPLAWYMMKDYPVSRLERVYYRSKAKHLFDDKTLTWEMFLERIELARTSRFIIARRWPIPMGSVVATVVPVLPFGRHIALGVGASTERFGDRVDELLDLIEGELARLAASSGLNGASRRNLQERIVEVDAGLGYLGLPFD